MMVEEDEVPKLVNSDQQATSPFYNLYVNGKVLGEVIPIKFIMLKFWWNGKSLEK